MRAHLALVSLALLLAPGCAHFFVRSSSHYFEEGETSGGGRCRLEEGIALAEVSGSPEAIGAQTGTLFKDALETVRQELLESHKEAFDPARPRARRLDGLIPERYAREITAVAAASGAPRDDLLLANTLLDCCCTAFVASGSGTTNGKLLFARNMDFPGAHVLGPATVVLLVRPEGRKAFAAIGWPGVSAVISGMNEDGLCAAALVNEGAVHDESGVPLGFAIREVLEECSSVEEARALLHRTHVSSGHFVALADARTAAVFHQGGPDLLPHASGFLTCSNASPGHSGLQTDARSRALIDLIDGNWGKIDETIARRILGATHLEWSPQAMVFEPESRAVCLALGTTFRPAARQDWRRIDLAKAFTSGVDQARVIELDSAKPFESFRDHLYLGDRLSELERDYASR